MRHFVIAVRAGVWEGEGGVRVVLARCLRLKRARKREARGLLSERRVVRRVARVVSSGEVGSGEMAEGVILAVDFGSNCGLEMERWWIVG